MVMFRGGGPGAGGMEDRERGNSGEKLLMRVESLRVGVFFFRIMSYCTTLL